MMGNKWNFKILKVGTLQNEGHKKKHLFTNAKKHDYYWFQNSEGLRSDFNKIVNSSLTLTLPDFCELE